MSFNYLGTTWVPRSASDHASDLLANINSVLSSNNVQVNGVVVQFTASVANVVWLVCLAVGMARALYDQVLFAASTMFNISQCSDSQILAVLPLAGTQLISQAFTYVTVLVTAGPGGSAVIPNNAVLPFGTICNFVIATGATILANGTQSFLATASVAGPITVAPGTLIAFNPTITNVLSVTNPLAGVPGRLQETPQQVRQRLIQGNIADIGINGTVRAMLAIQGISAAVLYFNFDTVNNLLIPGGIVVPPRYAYMVLLGSDITGLAIAAGYAHRMTAPTMGALSQTFVTLSGQSVPVKYDVATGYVVYVLVYYDANSVTSVGFQTAIALIIAGLTPGIGVEITVAMIMQALQGFAYATITGGAVSGDNVTFANKVVIAANRYALFLQANVTVVAQ